MTSTLTVGPAGAGGASNATGSTPGNATALVKAVALTMPRQRDYNNSYFKYFNSNDSGSRNTSSNHCSSNSENSAGSISIRKSII